jgi:hypothetical protein
MAGYPAGLVNFRLNYEISPISLSGGIAAGIAGVQLPLLNLLQGANFTGLSGAGAVNIDDPFASFMPLPNTTLIECEIGKYPFANIIVAANAIIQQPLTLSMLMRCPVRDQGGYSIKTSVLTALQNNLTKHISLGGTFNVATPSFYYSNILLMAIRDVSAGESKQAQIEWRWDFTQPLVTLAAASAAMSQLMTNITSGLPTSGQLSGASPVDVVTSTSNAPTGAVGVPSS